jgi:CRP-like cAMP-binding protein
VAFDNLVYFAFFIGIISAASLPLGALTTLIWTPSDRSIAWLMAFGAGALLSAVTIDLFAPAVRAGMFIPAAIGAIIGSLTYLILNHQLNQQGGFLRKTATTIQYFRSRQRKQHQQFFESLNRVPLFQELPDDERALLLKQIKIVTYPADTVLYHHSDIQNRLFIIQKGEVKLRDPNFNLKTFIELSRFDAFGRMAFFTSLPNTTLAQAKTDVTLWEIDRAAFNTVLANTTILPKILVQYMKGSSELVHYLKSRHHMSATQINEHITAICQLIETQHRLPTTQEQSNLLPLAIKRLEKTHRFELFGDCHKETHPIIANRLHLHTLRAGQTVFSNKSDADRLYLLESGSVELIDPMQKQAGYDFLQPGDYFGAMAFVVGGQHASSAVAETDITFWILEKADFLELLNQVDPSHAKLKAYLKTEYIHQYLTQEQHLPENKAQRWVNQSVKHLLPGHLPSLAEFSHHLNQHKAAYMAIWLGILLDGIPESLMIGSHMTDGHMLSMSLLAGLFLSNYPEALSSSASMREQGIPFKKVLMAWTLLMVLTGIGAGLGSIVLAGATHTTFALIGGLAAGAMLTVIAETMLPEAYVKGGSIIGFVTLLGFLTAASFKGFDTML